MMGEEPGDVSVVENPAALDEICRASTA